MHIDTILYIDAFFLQLMKHNEYQFHFINRKTLIEIPANLHNIKCLSSD